MLRSVVSLPVTTAAVLFVSHMCLASEHGKLVAVGCRALNWSAPVTAAPNAGSRVARYPRLALGKRHTYVVGVDIQTFGDEPIASSLLNVWDLGHDSVGFPAGRFTYLYPRAAVDARDRLHVVWAEPDTLPAHLTAKQWLLLRPNHVWSAAYDPASGWSAPSRLAIETRELRWQWRGVGDNLGDGRSRQGIGLSTMRPPKSLPYLVLDADGKWRRLTIPFAGLYMNILSRGDWMMAAYAASDESWSRSSDNRMREDANSVFVRTSRDGGASWETPVLVQQGGTAPAHQLQALLGARGKIHLLWKQASPEGEVIRHVASTDGTVWSKPDDLFARGLDNFRAAIDGCGDVQIVAEDWNMGVSHVQLTAARWDGRWSEPRRIFADFEAMTPDVRSSTDGVLHVAFVGRLIKAVRPRPYATFYSRLLPMSR